MSTKKLLSLIALFLVIALVVISVFFMPQREVVVTNLPWHINADDEKQTQVLSLKIGHDSLAVATESIRKIPELAAFKNPDGSYLIEAYFSKVKQGPLQGSLAIEVDVEGVDLAAYARFEKGGKPMPSGKRKFVLSKTGIIGSNKQRTWKLAYMPATNYTADQMERFFGKPERKEEVNAALENWFYPAKGLLITNDKEGREVFYYSARAEYARLIDSVLKQQHKDE